MDEKYAITQAVDVYSTEDFHVSFHFASFTVTCTQTEIESTME